jgi:hypothetical protein
MLSSKVVKVRDRRLSQRIINKDVDYRIWRYVDFSKFLAMLSYDTLYFSRADLLNDLFEGYVYSSISEKIFHQPNYLLKLFEYYKPFLDQFQLVLFPDGKLESFIAKQKVIINNYGFDTFALAYAYHFNHPDSIIYLHQNYSLNIPINKMFFVNCWHRNKEESAAMWKIFCNDACSVAIQSTYSKLQASLPESCNFGKVTYYRSDSYFEPRLHEIPINKYILSKRKIYSYENEIRSYIFKVSAGDLDSGINVSVDIENLIENIYISPNSPGWFGPLLDDVLNKYKSNMNTTLVYSYVNRKS